MKIKNIFMSLLVVLAIGAPIKRADAMLVSVGVTSVWDFQKGTTVFAAGAVVSGVGLFLGGFNPVLLVGWALSEDADENKVLISVHQDLSDQVEVGLLSQREAEIIQSDLDRVQSQGMAIVLNSEQLMDKIQVEGSVDAAIEQIAAEDDVSVDTIRYLSSKLGVE